MVALRLSLGELRGYFIFNKHGMTLLFFDKNGQNVCLSPSSVSLGGDGMAGTLKSPATEPDPTGEPFRVSAVGMKLLKVN